MPLSVPPGKSNKPKRKLKWANHNGKPLSNTKFYKKNNSVQGFSEQGFSE
jgi:hypothetical protein